MRFVVYKGVRELRILGNQRTGKVASLKKAHTLLLGPLAIHTSGFSVPLCPAMCCLQLTSPVDSGLRRLPPRGVRFGLSSIPQSAGKRVLPRHNLLQHYFSFTNIRRSDFELEVPPVLVLLLPLLLLLLPSGCPFGCGSHPRRGRNSQHGHGNRVREGCLRTVREYCKHGTSFLFRFQRCQGPHGVRFPDMVCQNIGANPLATRAHRTIDRYANTRVCLGPLLRTSNTMVLMRERARGMCLCTFHGCLALPSLDP